MDRFAGHGLVKRIGVGGIASVYKAQGPTGAVVALKILNPDVALTEQIRQRFRQEFEVSRKVGHPQIVKYLAYGVEGGRPYLIMECLEGKSLWDRVRRQGPVSEGEIIRIVERIGAALDAGHRLDILHRDVKPNNIFLTQAGDTKLMDFGLVKELGAAKNLVEDDAILGTPFFMPPEQFFDADNVDRSADVYGLASTVYFALSGKIPFRFRGSGLLEKKLSAQFAPPGPSIQGISPEIRQVLAVALDPQPSRRPRSCAAFAQALRQAARPDAPAAPKGKTRRERRAILRTNWQIAGRCCAPDIASAARIEDISTEGVCLFLGSAFAPNTLLRLSFHFRDDNELWDYPMRVVDVRKSQSRWRHGCRFLQPIEGAELNSLFKEGKDKLRIAVAPSPEAS